jgi:hypothetical protein
MKRGAGPTRARIAPLPTNKPVPMAPPRALRVRLACCVEEARAQSTVNVQELNMPTLQPTMRITAPARLLGDRAGAMDKGLMVCGAGLCIVGVRGGGVVGALFGVQVKVGHDVGRCWR